MTTPPRRPGSRTPNPPPGIGNARAAREHAISSYNTGRFAEAARAAQAALNAGLSEDGLVHILGASLVRIGSVQPGIRLLRELCDRGCPHPEAWCDLANGLRSIENIDGAQRALEHALKLRPHFPPAVRGIVTLLNGDGRASEAGPILDAALRAAPNDVSCALAFASVAGALKRAPEAIELLSGQIRSGLVPTPLLRAAHTELARLLDAEHRYDEAFEHAALGARAGGPIPQQGFFDATIAFWTPERFASISPSRHTDPLPVLVLGMPRSGTSLVDQIISSHPDVGSIGESPALPRIEERLSQLGWPPDGADAGAREYLAMMRARCPGKSRVIDKLPGNYTILAPISRLLPGARIIYCVRDARDTCLSCFMQNFGSGHGYTRDLATLGRKYVAHERLMSHWREALSIEMLEVRYEDLVANLEECARRMLDYVGVAWDPRVLEFHLNKRHMRTASAGQVHRPLFTTSIGRWKHYERHLGPLLDALGPRGS